MKLIYAALIAITPLAAAAQAVQPGIGPTGSMYNGNNTQRSPIAARPDPNRTPPVAGAGVTSTSGQQSRDESGGGAGGGEH